MSTSVDNVSPMSFATVSLGPSSVSNIERSYQASEAQLEIWLSSQQSVEASCSYNEICTIVLRGDLDVDRLRRAMTKVMQRNQALRTTFSSDGQFAQVMSDCPFGWEEVDFSAVSADKAKAKQNEIVAAQGHAPFDLENGPLLRCVLQKINSFEHRLTFTAHHIIMDGWSLAVFCRDLGWFYDEAGGLKMAPLPAVDDYEVYSKKLQDHSGTPEGQADETFWCDQFADRIPVLDLPIAKRRPALRTYSGDRYDHVLSPDLIERVRKIGAKSGCSLFNVMLSAFSAYVARISGNDDFCIGIPTAGQAAMDSGNLIGHCVNALPWRTQVDTAVPFIEYMKTSRSSLLNALDHQRYSYGELLRKLAPPRDPSRAPMLSVSFNVDPVLDTSEMGFAGIDVAVEVEPRAFENFEWFVNGVISKDKSVEMQVQYNSDLFTAEAMKFYFDGFEAFLGGVAEIPDSPISLLPLMSINQRQRVVVDFNETTMEYPQTSTLHQEFARQATATPEKTAVQFEGVELTYAEVDSRSNQIARYLNDQGIVAGDLVGICVNRSAEMLVLLYGIMKSGAGYVPLDPAYPTDRLQYMCDHSGLKLIVTESELEKQVSEFGKPILAIDNDQAVGAMADTPTSSLGQTSSPTDVCYVIYTSGSTGKPKGVQVPHGAVVNFLYSMKEQPGFEADDSILAVTTLSFDIAVLEMYLPTIFGGKVVVVDSLTATDGGALIETISKHGISVMQATPATWRLMIGAGWSPTKNLKVLCGGEPMPRDLVGPLLERCGQLWNMYGPTETTVWSAVFQITDADAPILIGKPVGNTQIYIFDDAGNEVPTGCAGELYIGGAGVTLGYRNRQDLTDERFIENPYRNPFADYVSDRLYKTGDLAKFRFDGNVEFLRRNDKQVKVRGFRIELGEIENALASHPAIAQNVVIVREDTVGDTRLVAYFITKSDDQISATELKDHLRSSLPYYMIPQHFVALESFPQTNNGKIDYNALPKPTVEVEATPQERVASETPMTAAQTYMAGIWAEVLEMDYIELNDNFFDIGGHSLLVMRVIKAVQERTGVKLGPPDFLMGTMEQLADRVSDCFEESDADREVVETQTQSASISAAPIAATSETPTDSSADTHVVAVETPAAPSETSSGSILKSLKGFWKAR